MAREVAVHRITAGPWCQNCYVVWAAGGDAVVIDPGGAAEQIAEHVDANRLRLHAALATHGHHDHIGAVAEVVARHEVPFGIHAADADNLRRVNLYRFALHKLGPVDVPPIGLDLSTTTVLQFGRLELLIVHTPGHSPGSVCIAIEDMLFTGDTLLASGAGRSDMPGSDPVDLRRSARGIVRAYPSATMLYPGHGEPTTLGQASRGLART